jgi:hypothetical protein
MRLMDRDDVEGSTLRAALIIATRERPFIRWRELKQSERDEYVRQGRRVLESLADYQPEWWHIET